MAYTPPNTLTPTQAAYVMRQARQLRRDGKLSDSAFTVLDTILWMLRPRGADRVQASYSGIAEVSGKARSTVVAAIKDLIGLGLFTRLKTKALRLWHNGGRQWRQLANIYVFRCESIGRSESQEVRILILPSIPDSADTRAAQSALEARRREIEGRLLRNTCR